jgi:hypothetical protein
VGARRQKELFVNFPSMTAELKPRFNLSPTFTSSEFSSPSLSSNICSTTCSALIDTAILNFRALMGKTAESHAWRTWPNLLYFMPSVIDIFFRLFSDNPGKNYVDT